MTPRKIFIPTAGLGSRLESLTKFVNKSLVSVNNKPVISHQIERLDHDSIFVIGLGYKGNLVREFLELAYPKKKFEFVNVFPYEGKGSGLGFTLLSCQKKLNEPFIFSSCDTLIKEEIPQTEGNWVGYSSEYNDCNLYRTILNDKENVYSFLNKGVIADGQKAYIGLCSIYDYQIFWEEMKLGQKEAIEQGEVYGLIKLLQYKNIKAFKFDWNDTGSLLGLEKARKKYKDTKEINILEKENEAIWFVDNKVIKYSADENFIKNRVKRAKLLIPYIPEITESTSNFYTYKSVEGEIMSNISDINIFNDLMEFSSQFWKEIELSAEEENNFQKLCNNFYRKKTNERINKFHNDNAFIDKEHIINGIKIPTLEKLFENLDWSLINKGIPVRFHGDFHFENILYSKENNKFTFLDWRQDFAGSIKYGDIYYDLSKLLHGLIINHEAIYNNLFSVNLDNNNIEFEFMRRNSSIVFEQQFIKWLELNNFNVNKVNILTALIFLNISPLHHQPYGNMLYALGKLMLYKNTY